LSVKIRLCKLRGKKKWALGLELPTMKDIILKISPHVTKSTGGYSDVLILEHRFRRMSSEKKVIDNS
jgi:hypothetical protein